MTAARTRTALWVVALTAATWGCQRRETVFKCRDDRQCVSGGVQGVCQPTAMCSFADKACASGQRYREHVPSELRQQCVVAATCGDGELGSGEGCDDGNQDNDDGCTRGCVRCDASVGDERTPAPDGSCFARFNAPLRWHKAQAICEEQGGHLATFASATEQASVERHLLKGDRARFWIGHHIDLRQSTTEWVTGEPVMNSHWHPGSKLGAGVQGDCTSMSPGNLPGKSEVGYLWSLEDCSNARPFVCEVPPWRSRPNGRGAYRMLYQELSWDDAVQACAQLGAHMVVIDDQSERVFVTDRYFGPFWIGATDREREGRFSWIDGSPFRYSDFAHNEPDNHHGDQHCLLVERDGHWHDRTCHYRHRTLCERD